MFSFWEESPKLAYYPAGGVAMEEWVNSIAWSNVFTLMLAVLAVVAAVLACAMLAKSLDRALREERRGTREGDDEPLGVTVERSSS
ncbi:hypothetical protein [Allokutzneria albata]|nr:hypothetical protein [Allokutzneria albata]